MDITLKQSELSKVLFLTQNIVEKKTTMPILANVLLSATESELKISATDLEVTAITKASADVRVAGSTTVNARVFGDIVRELPDGEVHLQVTEGERLEITCGGTEMRMVGVSAEEYPSLPGISVAPRAKMEAAQLIEMISKTLYAVSHDETRFKLKGVCFAVETSGKDKLLRAVATDGHRLAIISRPSGGLEFDGQVIIPRKGLAELKKVLSDAPQNEVGVDVQEGFLVVDAGDTKVSVRLIDGEFPDYMQVVPKDEGTRAVLDTRDLVQALRRVALMVSDKGKCARFDFSKGELRITGKSPELGDAKEELKAEYSGDPVSIGFNANYVMDVAQSIGEDQTLVLELHGDLGAGRFFAENDESYTGIVMPMRL